MKKLMWTEIDVPLGVRVNLYMPGSNAPEEIAGEKAVFRPLMGGIPIRKILYHMVNDSPVQGLEGFDDNRKFSPIESFTLENAPVGGEYIVYVNGEIMIKQPEMDGKPVNTPTQVLVRKDDGGKLIGSNGYLYQYFGRDVPLPKNVQLFRVDK